MESIFSLIVKCMTDPLRQELYSKVSTRTTEFTLLNDQEKFIFFMSCTDPFILNWLAKFVYKSFVLKIPIMILNNSMVSPTLVHDTVFLIQHPHEYHVLFYYIVKILCGLYFMMFLLFFTINGNFLLAVIDDQYSISLTLFFFYMPSFLQLCTSVVYF